MTTFNERYWKFTNTMSNVLVLVSNVHRLSIDFLFPTSLFPTQINISSLQSNNPSDDWCSVNDLGEFGLLLGVYDGISNSAASEATAHHLPNYILKHLQRANITKDLKPSTTISLIKGALEAGVTNFDDEIFETFFNLQESFLKTTSKAKKAELRFLLDGIWQATNYGTVAILCLIHPTGIYVANIGDSRAVLGRRGEYSCIPLSHDQDGTSKAEEERFIRELGDNPICGNRVAGYGPARMISCMEAKYDKEILRVKDEVDKDYWTSFLSDYLMKYTPTLQP